MSRQETQKAAEVQSPLTAEAQLAAAMEMIGTTFFPHVFRQRVPEFHRNYYRNIGAKRLLWIAPRFFSKSTIVMFLRPIVDAIFQRVLTEKEGGEGILIAGKTSALAEGQLAKIKTELDGNEMLCREFNGGQSFRGRIWNEDEIVLTSGVRIVAKGVGEQFRGFHPQVIFLDDLEDNESVKSATQREKVWNWFTAEVIPMLEDNEEGLNSARSFERPLSPPQLHVVGTVVSELCLVSRVYKDKDKQFENWTKLFSAAMTPDLTESLWPERWPVPVLLERKKEIGDDAFASEYMGKPTMRKGAVFDPDTIQWIDDAEFPDHRNLLVMSHIDPSPGTRQVGDYAACVAVGVCFNDMRPPDFFVMPEIVHGRYRIYDLVDAVYAQSQRYFPREITCEDNSYQAVLKDVIDVESAKRGQPLPVVGVTHSRDKVVRANQVTYLFSQRRVYFQRNNPHHRKLFEEMSEFPFGTYDDLTDALIGALQAASTRAEMIFSQAAYREARPTIQRHLTMDPRLGLPIERKHVASAGVI